MIKIPTDTKILNEIHNLYSHDYLVKRNDREAIIYVPIDCARVAKNLGTDGDIIFGRLYNDLEHKYGYRKDDDSVVHFFAFKIQKDMHCINFPLLSSVLAGLQSEESKFNKLFMLSFSAIIISIASLLISYFK
jgi:hypothetical protein